MTIATSRCLKMSDRHDIRKSRKTMDADTLSVLLVLRRDGRLGRENLADKIGIGYGSIRSILDDLSSAGLIDTYQTGSTLSPVGKRFMDACPISLADCSLPECSWGGIQAASVIRGGGRFVTNGMLQRDAGVLAGGYGCTTLIARRGGRNAIFCCLPISISPPNSPKRHRGSSMPSGQRTATPSSSERAPTPLPL